MTKKKIRLIKNLHVCKFHELFRQQLRKVLNLEKLSISLLLLIFIPAGKIDYSGFHFSESHWDWQDRSDCPALSGACLLVSLSHNPRGSGCWTWRLMLGAGLYRDYKYGKVRSQQQGTQRGVQAIMCISASTHKQTQSWHSWIIRAGSYRKEILWTHKSKKHWPNFSLAYIPPLPAGSHRNEENANRLFQISLVG